MYVDKELLCKYRRAPYAKKRKRKKKKERKKETKKKRIHILSLYLVLSATIEPKIKNDRRMNLNAAHVDALYTPFLRSFTNSFIFVFIA